MFSFLINSVQQGMTERLGCLVRDWYFALVCEYGPYAMSYIQYIWIMI